MPALAFLSVPGAPWAAGIAVAVTVVADWVARWRGDARAEAVAKPAATVAIAALALAVGADAPGSARLAAVVAFACCLAGDVALLPAVDRFVVGLASFLVGHVAFVVMCVALGLERPVLLLAAVPIVAVTAGSVGRAIVRGARVREPALAVPVTAYLVVILAMALVAWATGRPAAAIGASLFVASDAVLGWERFVGERRWMHLAIMVTYHGALVGLALALR